MKEQGRETLGLGKKNERASKGRSSREEGSREVGGGMNIL